jgi:hypothetical protein
MLTIRKQETFDWPVPVQRPRADGKFDTHVFTATFKAVPSSRFKELMDAHDDAVVLQDVWVGWSEINDEHGKPVSYSDEMRETLMEDLAIRRGTARAYAEAMTGQEYRRKN